MITQTWWKLKLDKIIMQLDEWINHAVNALQCFNCLINSWGTLTNLPQFLWCSVYKKKSTKNNTCYIYWLSEPQIVSKRLQNHCIPNDFYSFLRNILGTFFPVNKLYCVVSLRPQFVLLSLAVQTIESVLHQEEIVERKLMNLKMRCHGVDPLSDGFEIWLFPALRWLSQ